MWKYNGVEVPENGGWTDDNGVKHPRNWMIWDDDYKVSMGLVYEADPEPEVLPLDRKKQDAVDSIEYNLTNKLQLTDRDVLTYLERGEAIPADILAEREAARNKARQAKLSVMQASSEAVLKTISLGV